MARDQRGAAVLEFALVSLIILLVIVWSTFFYELIQVKLKVQEASRFAAWEFTAFQLSDYNSGSHGGRFSSARNSIRNDTFNRYKALGLGRFNVATEYEINSNDVQLENRGDPMLAQALAAVARNRSQAWSFNTRGYIKSTVTARVQLPGASILRDGLTWFGADYSPHIGTLNLTESNYLLADSWKLEDGSDVPVSRNSGPFYRQVDRVIFLDPALRSGLQIASTVVFSILQFGLGAPPAIVARLASLNYKGSATSGDQSLSVDSGQRRFETIPFCRDCTDNEHLQVFQGRGDNYLGCNQSQQFPCGGGP